MLQAALRAVLQAVLQAAIKSTTSEALQHVDIGWLARPGRSQTVRRIFSPWVWGNRQLLEANLDASVQISAQGAGIYIDQYSISNKLLVLSCCIEKSLC